MSAEQREQERRTRLIDAAIELIGTRGATAATVTAVCALSRVTSRYFYQHFSDREGLLRAVYRQVYSSMQEAVVDAISQTDVTPAELAYDPLRALVDMIEQDRRLARIVFVESSSEPILRELRSELVAGFAELVLHEARLHFMIADSAVGVAHLASTLGVGGLFEVFRRWVDGELDFTSEDLVRHCAGLIGGLGMYVLSRDERGDMGIAPGLSDI
jgi:AcrR family transcriptional regulator